MSTLSVRKTKATWTPALHEIFVDLCLEQTLKGINLVLILLRKVGGILLIHFKKGLGRVMTKNK